jgi:RHS repeat-associated protein
MLSSARFLPALLTFTTLLSAGATARAQTCDFYPIALSAQSLSNAAPGTVLANIYNGAQPGNFGWLSWSGSPGEPALVTSLTPPGNSATYVNPADPSDHHLRIGDWVSSKPGVSNSKNVRDALDKLETVDITVPVWNQARGQGANAQYRISGFAAVRLISYQLPSQNRITAKFLGFVACDATNQAPSVDAGADQTITLPATTTLTATVRDDGRPTGASLVATWSQVSGPGTVTFSTLSVTNPLSGSAVSNWFSTVAAFSSAGTYVLRLTANDSQLTASDDVIVTVNRANRAPVALTQAITINEDSTTNITLQGSDPDGDPISYSVTTQPNYGTLSGTPPNVVYTPNPDFNGLDQFTFKVNDGQLDSSNATVAITILPVNDAPIADAVSVTNFEDTRFDITLSGSDVEGSALTYRVVAGPAHGAVLGAAIGPLSGSNVVTFQYQPDTNFFGNDSITYVVNDGTNDSAPATVSVVVLPVDDVPVVDAGPEQLIVLPTNSVSLSGSVLYDLFPNAVDSVQWTQVSGPGTVTFGDAGNEATSATFSQSGVYVLQLTASDSFLSASDDVTITVNAPPEVNAGPDQTNTYPAGVTLNGSVTDDGVPGGAVSIAWSVVSGPGTVVFSAPNSAVTGASFSDGGIYVLRLTANDGVASVSDDVTVMINRAPLVDAGSDQLVTNLQASLNGTVFDDGLPAGIVVATWSQVSGPGTVTFSPATATNGSANATATFSVSGVYVLRLTADDSLAQTSDDVTISVDGAPQVAVSGDALVNFPAAASLTATALDDGLPTNSTTYEWSQVSGPGTVTFSDTAGLATSASFSAPGVYVVQFSASDSLLTTVTNWTIVVNQAPVVSAGAAQLVTLPQAATLNGSATDDGLPSGTLTYLWTKVSGPGAVNFGDASLPATTATFSASGLYTLQLTANDGAAESSAQVTVRVNTTPTAQAQAVSVNEDSSVTIALQATDADNDTLTYAIVTPPAHGTLNPQPSNPGMYVYAPEADYFGPDNFTFNVNDGTVDSAPAAVSVTVAAVNDAPSFVAGGNQITAEDGGSQTVTAWATGISAGPANESSQTVHFLVSSDNASLFSAAPAVSSNGTLTYTPAPDANGVATVTVRAQDDGGTANGGVDTSPSQTFTITVTAVNDAPSFTAGSNQAVLEDSGAQTVTAWASAISAGPANESAQSVSFLVSSDNAALFSVAPAIASNGTLTFTPAPDANGIATVTVRVHDDGGTANGGVDTSASQTFTITVTAVNDAPSFTAGSNQAVLEDTGAQTVSAWASAVSAGPANESSQSVHFQVSSDNASMFSVAPAVSSNGTLTYTPAPEANGVATVTVRAQDDGGTASGGVDTSAPQTFTITVTAVNDAPSFTAGSNQAVLEDSGAQTVANWAMGISAGPTNESSQTVTFQVSSDNPGLFSLAPAVASNGTLTYTPAADANGVATVTVRAHDDGGIANGGIDTSAPQTFTITVTSLNDAPSFTAGSNQTVAEDSGPQTVPGWASTISPGPANESTQTVSFLVNADLPALFSAGPAVAANGTLTYTPATNATGVATVTVRAQDNGGTANGGADTSVPQTFTITITPVNDAPHVTVPGAQAVGDATALVFNTNRLISVSDVDAGQGTMQLSLSAAHGAVTLSATNGLVIISGANSSSNLVVQGTLTSLNSALLNSFYSSLLHFSGTDTLAVAINDLGNTGAGGPLTDSRSIAIAVTPTNHPPIFTSTPVTNATSVPFYSNGQMLPLSAPASVDLSHWTVVQYDFGSTGQGDSRWTLSQSNTVAFQAQNSDASILLSDITLFQDQIQGTLRATDTTDDDFIGFVFGYQDSAHYYLFDWRSTDQLAGGFGEAGMSVKVVQFDPTAVGGVELWSTYWSNSNQVHTIYHNTIPYKYFTDYQFTLNYFPGDFTITVRQGTNVVANIHLNDATFPAGKFGFYNYSQPGVSYSGFTQQRIGASSYVYQAAATDADNDSLTYSLTTAPTNMTINASSGLIQWYPNASVTGTFPVTVRVSDGHGGVALQTYNLFVPPPIVNKPPFVSGGANIAFDPVPKTVALNGVAIDAGVPLSVTWSNLYGPATVAFSSPTTAVTSATFAAPGLYVLQLKADDSLETATNLVEVRAGMLCTVNPPDGMTAWWTANLNPKDLVAGNVAVLQGTTTYGTGEVGPAFQFDGGIGNYIQIAGTTNTDIARSSTGFTIEFWTMSTGSSQTRAMFSWNDPVGIGYATKPTSVQMVMSGVQGFISLLDTNGNGVQLASVGNIFNGAWHHVALTYDKSTSIAREYVDGILISMQSIGAYVPNTAGDFYFGKAPTYGNFIGSLDEVCLYNRRLTGEEIYNIFAAGTIGKCPPDANSAPVVYAGADQFIRGVPGVVTLNGQVSDDGLPAGSTVTTSWSVFSGPGTVTFANSNSVVTSATFSTNGIYVLQLTASDGEAKTYDVVEVRVESLCTVDDPAGLVAWWPANGTRDDVINGIPAVLVDGAGYSVGKVASAFNFDGVNDAVLMAARTNYDIGTSAAGFTIEFWENSDSAGPRGVFSWNNTAQGGNQGGVTMAKASGSLFTHVTQNNGVDHQLTTIANVFNGTWRHIALTYDRPSGIARVYVDAVLQLSQQIGSFQPQTSYDLVLGQAIGTSPLLGQLDEFSLYRRPLSATEILSLYQSGSVGKCLDDTNHAPVVYAGPDLFVEGVPGTATLAGEVSDDGAPFAARVQWSKFSGPGIVTFANSNSVITSATFSTNGIYVLQLTADDGEAQSSDIVEVRVETLCTVQDPAGLAGWWPGNGTPADVMNGIDATLLNGTIYSTGKVAGAFQIDGANDGVWIAAATNYDVGTSASGFTVEFWENGDASGTPRGVFSWNTSLLGGSQIGITMAKASGSLFTHIVETNGVDHQLTTIAGVFNGTFRHIALTYDRPSGIARVYVDSVLQLSQSVGSFQPQTSYDLILGQAISTSPFAAQIDEFSLYRRPLSPNEILNLYLSGSVGKCPNDNNAAPIVYAGPDISIASTNATATLNGVAADDGLPVGSVLRTHWSAFAGPGTVTFANSNSPATTASFNVPGLYTLRLTVDDGEEQVSDFVDVRVGAPCTVSDPSGLAASWPANGTAVDTVSGVSGILAGGASYTTGKVGAAFNFNGSGFVEFAARTNYDIAQSAAGFTIEFWENSPGGSQTRGVFGWNNGAPKGVLMLLSGNQGFISLLDTNGNGTQLTALSGIFNGAWHHIAVTYSNKVAREYADGVLKVTQSITNGFAPMTAFDLYLGQVPTVLNYIGALDEFSLYNRPLSQTEIQAIFNAGAGGKCVTPANQPPLVFAGVDQTISLPTNHVTLQGVVADDGQPSNSLAIAWTYVSGPSTVFFSALNTPVTTVTFTNAGVYTFQLAASDGVLATNDTVTITVLPDLRVPPTVTVTSPQNGSIFAVTNGGSANLTLTATATDLDDAVVGVQFFVNGLAVGTDSTSPYTVVASNLPPANYLITAVATDASGLSTTSAPVSAIVYVDSGPPMVQIAEPADSTILTAPSNIIGAATSPILSSWQVRYRLAPNSADQVEIPTDSEGWVTLSSGSNSIVNAAMGVFDPTLLLNGIYQVQVVASDLRGRTAFSEPITVIVDRNLKIGQFTISFNDLAVPVPGLPLQITRTYDSRAAASGVQGDFGAGWTLDIHNVRLQKNRPLGRNWVEYSTGSPFDLSLAYHLDPGNARIVTITFPDGRVEKFELDPYPLNQALEPIEFPQWNFTPIGNTRGTLVPATYDEVDGNFLIAVGDIPGTVDLNDLNFFSGNPIANGSTLQSYPTLFRYTSPEGYKYLIDEVGGLKSVTDPNGNTLVVSTNGLTWNNALAGTNSLSIAFQRDDFGRITNIVDAIGHAMSYRYDTNGNLVTFVNRAGETNRFAYTNPQFPHYLTSITDARGVTPVQNVFDASGRLISNVDAFGDHIRYGHDIAENQEYVTNQLGFVTINDYDDAGNVIHMVDANGAESFSSYDINGNLLQTIDPLGRTNKYTYDDEDNRLTATDPLGNTTRLTYSDLRRVTSVTDPRGNTISNRFDGQGNLLAMRDPLGRVTTFAYNNQGLPVAMTNALGQVMKFGYDPEGRLIAEQDALGHETDYQRDGNGNLLQQTTTRTTAQGIQTLAVQFFYDSQSRLTNSVFPDGSSARTIYNAIGKPAITIDQLGRQTAMVYDELGRVTQTVYPDGSVEASGYDAAGERIASTNRLGQVMQYVYDPVGREIRTIYPDNTTTSNYFDLAGELIASTDARGNSTVYGYDAAGRSVAVTNALGQVSLNFYDVSGNLTNSVDALGRSTKFVYDALNRRVQTIFADGTTQTTVYDQLGRRVSETDQAGKTTAFGLDTLGRMVAVTNALGYVTSYAYDELGQQISQTDANNHTTTFEYDSLGRRVKRTLPGNQVETYAYNIGGLLTNRTDFNGYTTTYQYDPMNRLLAKLPDSRRGEPPITFGYNVLGLRTNMTDASGSTAYAYDGRNRLVQKTRIFGGTSFTSSLNYNYDVNGNLTNILSSDPNGVSVGYEYDALNRLSAVNDAKLGRTAYSYDDIGNLQGSLYPNSITTIHEYDSLNRLTNMASDRLLTPIANYAYTVGAAGNRLTATETLAASALNPQPRTINRVYSYDNLYRLTGETIGGTSYTSPQPLTYSYDPVGNRLTRGAPLPLPLSPQSFSYDPNDRLNTDTYDNNGNTLVGAGFGQAQSDQYDFENRLVTRHTSLATIAIAYDGDGNRVRKTVTTATNSVTTCFVVDDLNPSGYAQVLEEHVSLNSGPSSLDRVYTYGHTLISQDRVAGASWHASFYGYDGHNNVRYLTDINGQVTDTYDYDAFGNLIAQTGSTPNNYLFTGEQYDPDLGLYYLRARYHNPDTGRFWSMDSFEGFGEDPSSMHKYNYCGANPINAYDPSGNFSLVELGHSMAIGGLTTAWTAGIFRALGAASAGAGWKGSLDAANDGIGSDFLGGAIGGAFGFGLSKAAVWAIGKAAPYLLEYTPTFAMWFNKGTAQLGRLWRSAEAAWAQVELEIRQGSEAAAQLARNAASKLEAEATSLLDELSNDEAMLGWGGQSSESYAATQLQRLEANSENAHFLSRHGPQTTLEQQYVRATTGVTPDGMVQNFLPDASRFLSNQDQLDAAMIAIRQFNKTGESVIDFTMGKVVGEGYTSGGANYVVTRNIRAVFRNGKLYTLFPLLRAIQ